MSQLTQRRPFIDAPAQLPSLRAAVTRGVLRHTVSAMAVQVQFPDGTTWGAGDAGDPRMDIARPQSMFRRIGAQPKIGLGEAYTAGDWHAADGTDLADLLTPFAARLTRLVPGWMYRLRRLVDVGLPNGQRNTVQQARGNIEAHYDLSNELFTRFLDPSLSYSSAFFADLFDDTETLEAAQLRKIDAVLDDARVGPGTRLLEIGSGWGSLAIRAAQRGAVVTTVTLSSEQADLARDRFAAAGVADRIDLQLCDYREVTGEFDAIVSVEMIEAVGEEFWPVYFRTLDDRLAPGGRVALQSILMAHHRYLATRNSFGWIQKHIFPGGLIPSLDAIGQTVGAHTRLRITDGRSIGQHYARTLRTWREQFNRNWHEIHPHGFDEEFRRSWEFYLAYCEAGFRVGYLDVQQLTLARSR